MLKLVVTLVSALALVAEPAATITGTWNMGLQGDHVIPVALVLKQDGKHLTGTITLPTQRSGERIEIALSGEFVDGALSLSGEVEHAAEPTTIVIDGTLKDDGSIEGTFKGPHGVIPYSAERLKERK
jgi:hypothetical protein